jgi:ANTAR domain
MTSRHSNTGDAGRPHDRERDEAAAPAGAAGPADQHWRPARKPGKHAAQGLPDQGRGQPGRTEGTATGEASGESGSPLLGAEPVARRTATGWRVGDEEVSDLTSAMVLADLLAADLPAQGTAPSVPAAPPAGDDPPDARKLEQTVAQLEHALTARVRVEQAIGVLAERHRLRPRQAFELLRSVARAQGRRVLEMAIEVVDSATNPLLRIPEELAKPPLARRRGRVRAGWQPEPP